MEIRICPNGRLVADLSVEDEGASASQGMISRDLFNEQPLGEGLLQLGYLKAPLPTPSLSYWQQLARLFLSTVCKTQRAESSQLEQLPSPSQEEWESMLEQAPLMKGGEYLRVELLQQYWAELVQAFNRQLTRHGRTMQQHMDSSGSDWHLSGRVCFHLAENKLHPTLPFAFLATYVPQSASGTQSQHLPLHRAIQEYSQDRGALLQLLSPIQTAAATHPWVKQLIESGEVFQPQAWTPQQAHQFLKTIPHLEQCGIQVRIPNWWSRKKPNRVKASIVLDESPSGFGLTSMLSFDVQMSIGDATLTEEEWQSLQQQQGDLVRIKGQWIEVDRDKLNHILKHWNTLKRTSRDGLTMAEGLRLLAGMETRSEEDPSVQEEHSSWSEVIAGTGLAQRLQELRHPHESERVTQALADSLKATLRPYQQRGVQWLWTLSRLGLGGCLADDMGLGKTIQVLSFLLSLKHLETSSKRHLLVVPASLVGNWQREAARFTPSLRVFIAHGPKIDWQHLPEVDVIITTYANLLRRAALKEYSWDVVILDEAQAIKNPNSKQTQAAKALAARMKLALTGTPIENSLSDLWSLFDFILPGLLGSAKQFQTAWKGRSGAPSSFLGALHKLTHPYLLRRLKTDKNIISDLPDKIEMPSHCFLSPEQATLYQATVSELAQKLETADGMQRRGLVLGYLGQLKQVCNHPDHWRGVGAYDPAASGKWKRLEEICSEIAERQERVLVFTQFKSIMPPLFDFLTKIFGRPGLMLHGDTPIPERALLVEEFQEEDGPPFFLLSLKAGGTGLTLTQANHVIHFDRWWNPAVENQATDRAFRIGQKKSVTVHPFVCQGTIEEKISALLTQKKALSQEILAGDGELSLTELSNEQLIQLVSLDLQQAVEEL